MTANGTIANGSTAHVLRWSGRVLSAEDVRQNLNGHREILLTPRTVITPLAADELRSSGVRIVRNHDAVRGIATASWGYAQENPHPLVESAVRTLERDGVALRELFAGDDEPCRWARAVADCIARGECTGGVLFCRDPGVVCCVANKVPGLRSVAVATIGQAARATLTLGPNLVAVEMPGRTFFEIRQILHVLAACTASSCPRVVADTLKELDGHAHR